MVDSRDDPCEYFIYLFTEIVSHFRAVGEAVKYSW